MLLQAWSVCCRALHSKLPIIVCLYQINAFYSPQCRICQANEDNIVYFLVLCPFKHRISQSILQPYYANMNLQPAHMLALLRTLKASRLVHPSRVHTILTIVWITLWLLWISH